MWHHFWDVAVARDAVIQGDLADARRPLLRIANGKVQEDLPQDWMPWIEEMRAEARKASEAKSLRDMANVVTAVSEQCAECHRTTRGGPVVKVDSLDYGHPKDRSLHGVMERHAWAADELWVGMTVPSSPSWARGAIALAEFAVPGMEDANSADGGEASQTGGANTDIDPAMIPRLEAVRALGKRAEAAGQPFEQTAVFSELIALCGDCHSSLQADAPPSPELAH
jgi:cytochrome c553